MSAHVCVRGGQVAVGYSGGDVMHSNDGVDNDNDGGDHDYDGIPSVRPLLQGKMDNC